MMNIITLFVVHMWYFIIIMVRILGDGEWFSCYIYDLTYLIYFTVTEQ